MWFVCHVAEVSHVRETLRAPPSPHFTLSIIPLKPLKSILLFSVPLLLPHGPCVTNFPAPKPVCFTRVEPDVFLCFFSNNYEDFSEIITCPNLLISKSFN